MKILINHEWREGFLDQALLPETVRLKTLAWFNLYKINDLYFIPARSWRLIFNYIKEIGIQAVLRKIVSRLKESARNEKYLSFGIGCVLESHASQFKKDEIVMFFALCHPQCMERVVLSANLLLPLQENIKYLPQHGILYADLSQTMILSAELYQHRGWSEYAGIHLSSVLARQLPDYLTKINQSLQTVLPRQLPVAHMSEVKTITTIQHNNRSKLRAGLFGYGQYAKTIILPSIKKWVDVVELHEIDVTQLPQSLDNSVAYSSSPVMNDNNQYDLCFIASYHHTHAGLAINALKAGIAAIVEKPVVTNQNDLTALLKTMEVSQAPLFSCFHKRYLPFNTHIYKDLNSNVGDPISCHCVVFEVRLPALHWYRWPNSGSRLLSNGCHWIDYFLFLNNFSNVAKFSLQPAKNGDVSVFIELENNAVFTMTLTESGSQRLGLREHIELRAGDSTIIITDGCHYQAENHNRILRKISMKRLAVYPTMYQTIVQKILQKEPGDSIESVARSSGIILALEAQYQAQTAIPEPLQQQPQALPC